jgi:hypothetical protein
MPQCVNLHEAGLRRSPRLQELEAKKFTKKTHFTWATKTTQAISLFTLFSLVTDVKIDMPAYNISPTATLAEHAVCRFHEVNELYGGTLNSICAYAFSTIALDMTNNEVFTYTKTFPLMVSSTHHTITTKTCTFHRLLHRNLYICPTPPAS